jgi:polyhydroxyalkanoate synthesis regulator phasin
MKVDLRKLTRDFILGESLNKPNARAYVESVLRILDEVRPKSQRESRQLSVARQNLLEIKKVVRQLESKITLLEEQVRVLEEGKE